MKKLGPYTIKGKALGAKGNWTVWRATKGSKEYAIKAIRIDPTDDTLSEQLRREVRIMKGINSSCVLRVQAYEEHVEDGANHFEYSCLIMEYAPGGDLGKIIKRKKQLAIKAVLKIAWRVAHGLQDAHREGIFHCDLKPQNILIAKRGNVKVADFGIARTLSKSSAQNTTFAGTALYTSPEQADNKAANHLSDIYSFGAVLYEMLAGRPPFLSNNPIVLLDMHRQTLPKPLDDDVREDIPVGLANLVHACLEKRPEKRPQSFDAIIRILKDLGNEAGVALEEITAPPLSKSLSAALFEWTPKRIYDFMTNMWASVAWTIVTPVLALLFAGVLVLIAFFLGLFPGQNSPTATAQAVGQSLSQTPGITATRGDAAGSVATSPSLQASSSPTITSTPSNTPTDPPPPTATDPPTATATASSTPTPFAEATTGINLRAGPGTNYPTIGQYPLGTRFIVIGKNSGGDWIHAIAPDQREGWVSLTVSTYTGSLPQLPVDPAPPTPTSPPAPTAAPTTAPAPPAATTAPVPPAATTAPASRFDGRWAGSMTAGGTFDLTVTNGRVTNLHYAYPGDTGPELVGDCAGANDWHGLESFINQLIISINSGGSFGTSNLAIKSPPRTLVTFNGTLNDNGTASGELQEDFPDGSCTHRTLFSWTATKQ